eukprot:scaffold46814_cov18-Prasinocladus_malaysianus.AAC.1
MCHMESPAGSRDPTRGQRLGPLRYINTKSLPSVENAQDRTEFAISNGEMGVAALRHVRSVWMLSAEVLARVLRLNACGKD